MATEKNTRKMVFAAQHGILVEYQQAAGVWRVIVSGLAGPGGTVPATRQVGVCATESDAADVAYGLAVVRAWSRR